MKSNAESQSALVTVGPEVEPGAERMERLQKKPDVAATLHLTFIDGMRGCAASYIVFHHALEASDVRPTNLLMRLGIILLGQGHSVVTIFIAISGFCLGLPVARNGRKLAGGARRFFKGRVHRILPPYYLVLALSIVVVTLLTPTADRWAMLRSPAMEFSILMHLLLLQNLNHATFYGINGPLWSIAMECQIYLVFPLMVLMWRRFGTVALLVGAFVLAHLAFHLTKNQVPFNYLFIFALGMAAASLAVAGRASKWLPWVCGISIVGCLLTAQWRVVVSDFFVGVSISTLIAMLSSGKVAWLRKFLSLRLLAFVGRFRTAFT